MKKILLLTALFFAQPLCAQVCYRFVDETGGVPSAFVFVNDVFASATDDDGKVVLSGLRRGDTIRVTHLAYAPKEFVLPADPGDTTIVLTPQYFNLEGTAFVKVFDYDVLREKLRDGLSDGYFVGKVPYVSRDTLSAGDKKLFLEERGLVSFPMIGGDFKLLKHDVTVLGVENSQKETLSKEEERGIKRDLISKIANAGALSRDICKGRKHHGLRVEYRGSDGPYEIFYFFVPPQDYVGRAKGSKYKGLAYIDAETGILDRVTATFTSGEKDFNSYQISVRYQYFEKTNTILPAVISHTSYVQDPDGSLEQTVHNHISIDWAHAL